MRKSYSKGIISYDVDGVFYHKSFSLQGLSVIPFGKIDSSITILRSGGEQLSVTILPDKNKEFLLHSCTAEVDYSESIKSVDINGYQSWSETREVLVKETQKKLNSLFKHWIEKYHLKAYGDEHFQQVTTKEGQFISYTWTCLTQSSGIKTLFGSTSEDLGFTQFFIDTKASQLMIHKQCEGSKVSGRTELLGCCIVSGEESDCYPVWQEQFLHKFTMSAPATGWTSWYNYYEKISEKIILENVKEFSDRNIPIDYIQIDDGWQKAVGDWLLVKDTFPHGMRAVAQKIKDSGYKPGLWLAPFVAEESSIICEKHADWLVRDDHGNFIIAGYNPFNWSGNFYVLDIYLPEVRSYLKRVFYTIEHTWGYDLVKLDFLYASALQPRKGRSRGQVMSESMRFLREISGSMKILGCGVPLGSSFGFVDYCRVGSDVSLGWEDLKLKMLRYKERVSTINSLTSTIGRAQINGRFFLNDPDVFILRDENTTLQDAQKRTLFMLNNALGGLVFTSDNIGNYSDEVMELYLSLFPSLRKQVDSIDRSGDLSIIRLSIGEKHYCLLSNLGYRHKSISLPKCSGYWFENTQIPECNLLDSEEEISLDGYTTRCFYACETGPWEVLGTTKRLFPVSEVHSHYVIEEHDGTTFNVYLEFEDQLPQKGDLFISVAKGVETPHIYLHGEPAKIMYEKGHTIAQFSLEHLL